MQPPASETDAQRIARLEVEAEAKRISEQIDEDLRNEREKLRKSRSDVKVRFMSLLLDGRAYTHSMLAAPTRSGRKRQVDAAEAISTDVQASLSGSRAHILENRYLLQRCPLFEANFNYA